MQTSPQLCDRFEKCAAPLCPLDDWTSRVYYKGESICHYLRNHPLEGLKQGCIPQHLGQVIGREGEKIFDKYRSIEKNCRPL
jgi:hypothetical protein